MKTTYTFYKNSNTGEIVKKQHFSEISFYSPDYYYNWESEIIDNPDLTGFVEISEKKFNKEVKVKARKFYCA